ncbi:MULTISPECIES: DUF1289 domain-containing protein [Shewanella]|uniref:DUF1289 domain-containing protein n=1 Tax=Shewanella holmiensis TaxID=2952222 RepID=A0A9X3AT86_9GAMM|nr:MULTISPECIES: DUF1289 domain-containing protein [Shewanella]MCT7940280.1 DUF1289 domain-containing protein [Shewanella holmiensis]MDP5147088.1 DUF1289 domain-containing protein [Shewanella sp. ULN5]
MAESKDVVSPCIRHCSLDEQDICLGCHRTLDEILGWHTMTNEQKFLLLTELQFRALNRQRPFKF